MGLIAAPTDNWNSFCSLADAAAYHSDRANTAWDDADDTDDKTPALIKATDYIAASYVFTIDPVDAGTVCHPISPPVVNPLVIKATALLALYALTNDLFEVRDERQAVDQTDSLSGLSSHTRYLPAYQDRFPAVSAILSPIGGLQTSGVVVGKQVR